MLLTRCPACRQRFHVAHEQIEAADGFVRCGECGEVFNALADLQEHHPSEWTSPSPASEGGGELADFCDSPAPNTWRMRGLWSAALVLAALALAVQIVHAERHAIAHWPVAGAGLSAIYRGLGLSLEPPLNLDRYVIAGAALAGRGGGGTLDLRGRLVNRASFTQRLPFIRLNLRDRRGRTIGSRLLLPSDYGATRISSLGAGRGFDFHVRLKDPGAGATGFTLLLCKRRAGRVVCDRS